MKNTPVIQGPVKIASKVYKKEQKQLIKEQLNTIKVRDLIDLNASKGIETFNSQNNGDLSSKGASNSKKENRNKNSGLRSRSSRRNSDFNNYYKQYKMKNGRPVSEMSNHQHEQFEIKGSHIALNDMKTKKQFFASSIAASSETTPNLGGPTSAGDK